MLIVFFKWPFTLRGSVLPSHVISPDDNTTRARSAPHRGTLVDTRGNGDPKVCSAFDDGTRAGSQHPNKRKSTGLGSGFRTLKSQLCPTMNLQGKPCISPCRPRFSLCKNSRLGDRLSMSFPTWTPRGRRTPGPKHGHGRGTSLRVRLTWTWLPAWLLRGWMVLTMLFLLLACLFHQM